MSSSSSSRNSDLKSQLDNINWQKRQIRINSQHFEKIKAITKDVKELRNLEQKVMEDRRKFLNYGINNF
ncbi:ac29 [Oxyplax ochracea nucleopolyhedrovirus]|uniref:Ac29 n=1 Tax=Oxyplax ochracea nucleopolyhedrovirus TaxID=2083176 RepID=A0A2L0WU88_9ABAC|nr:ac29 [Oxyplax ochracea nucleopolyhedrovirus]AVA31210.1 ac29 [Oxyplax ochracea nucleopolyhedrovirus]